MDPKSIHGSNQNSWKRVLPEEEFLPDGKEVQTYIFRNELDDEGFPKIFSLRTQEVRMFLRIVYFFTGRLLWEEDYQGSGALEILLGLQFIEWFENLSVSSNLLTKELHLVYTIWNSIFINKGLDSEDSQFHSKRLEVQRGISENPKVFGHLTFRNYRSECRRDTFLNYVRNHLVSYREIQRKSVNHTSHFKRSSEHSNSTRGNTSTERITSPRVKELEPFELLEFLELTPQERKLQLLGESS